VEKKLLVFAGISATSESTMVPVLRRKPHRSFEFVNRAGAQAVPALLIAVDRIKAISLSYELLPLQKNLWIDAGLLEYRAQRTLWHIAGVVRDGGIAAGSWVVPDFMAAGGLTVELQAQCF
jgi:hypothetical protein